MNRKNINPTLDAFLGGGVLAGSVIYVYGNPGTGRGRLAADFALADQEQTLWVSADGEAPLISDADADSWREALEEGRLTVREIDVCAMSPAKLLRLLERELRLDSYARVIISGADLFDVYADPSLYLKLVRLLRGHGATVLLTGTLTSFGGEIVLSPDILVRLVDYIFVTQSSVSGQPDDRTLCILKAPNTSFDRRLLRIGTSHGKLVFAPASGGREVARPAGADAQQVQQRFVVMPELFYFSPQQEELVQLRVREINRGQSSIRFELPSVRSGFGVDYNTQIEEFKAGRKPWDFFVVDVYRLPELMEQDLIHSLDEYFTPQLREEFLPVALDQCTIGGHICALPHWINIGVLAYRSDLLSKHHKQPPRTWDGLVETAAAIAGRKGSGAKTGYAFPGAQFEALTCNFLELLWNMGPTVYERGLHAALRSGAALQAAALMHDLVHRHKIARRDTASITELDTYNMFLEGSLLFMRSWPQVLTRAHSADSAVRGRVAIAPLPTNDAAIEPQAVLGGFCYVIPKQVEDPEPLMRFYREFYSASAIRQFALNGWTCPPFRAVYEDAEVLKHRPYYMDMPELLKTGRSRTKIAQYAKFTDLARREMNLMLRQMKSPEEAVATISDEMHRHVHKHVRELRLQAALEHIRGNLHLPLERDRVASVCRLSPTYFSSLFKDTLGISFSRYLNEQRVAKAKHLLETSDLTVGEVAVQCGFSDAGYFCQVFRQVTHMTPGQYRLNAVTRVTHR